MGEYRINTAVPNLVCICIDKIQDGDYSGRIYHKYSKEEIPFFQCGNMIGILDLFFDEINYPQASTRYRSFRKPKKGEAEGKTKRQEIPKEEVPYEEVLCHKGREATFILHVQYRQNSTWQGNLFWVEEECGEDFCSVLELLKLLDSAICSGESSCSEINS